MSFRRAGHLTGSAPGFGQKFGVGIRNLLTLFDKFGAPAAIVRPSSVCGSVTRKAGEQKPETCLFSLAYPASKQSLTCLENPRVGGSIPPQATNLKAQLFSVGLFLCPQPRNYGPFQPFYVCFDPLRVSMKRAVRLSIPLYFSKNIQN